MPNSFGLKISKPQYNANTAADANLLFSSGWPSLTLPVERTFTSGETSYTHSLGFVPFAEIYTTVGGACVRSFATSSLPVNSSTIGLPTSSSTTTVHLKLYNIDISTDVDYTHTTKAGAASPVYDPDYGIKYAKDGKDIESTDLRDFILHSRCQSPQVLAVKTQATAASSTVSYTSPDAYAAWVFGFTRKANGDYYFAPYFSQAYPRTFVTVAGSIYTYTVTYAGADTGASLLILRDPFFAPTDIQVTY